MYFKYLIQSLVLIFSFIGVNNLYAESEKVLRVKQIPSSIKVDGIIDPVWSMADSASDFVQWKPYHGIEPLIRTVVKLLTTDKALYCLIVCQDDKAKIQQNTGNFDETSGDMVSLLLDTFGDKRTAYEFTVTASGVRKDGRRLDDNRIHDYNWDGVWFSAAKVYDWGYVVEIQIPYRSIQYNEHITEWGLDFDRWIPGRAEEDCWCFYEANEGRRVSKFGKLVFEDFQPSVKGLNLEVYPVGLTRVDYLHDSKYKFKPDTGIDIFYNPSQRLTFQFTANPDFAQIEADPFSFNISRYETYFGERRPFFTEGNEVFIASGDPLELFYSRRIGKKLPDGEEVPLLFGTKAFGRFKEWEYGGFLALTGEKEYNLYGKSAKEARAFFASGRVKKQILHNSSVGMLFVGKQTAKEKEGVIDVDGALRSSDWQLAYQLARSIKDSKGDFAASAGFTQKREKWMTSATGRYIGENFDVNQVGFVPWVGTAELAVVTGPRWFFKEGPIMEILLYGGGSLNYERADAFTDRNTQLSFNMQFRKNWGCTISASTGRLKELQKEFTSYGQYLSTWFSISPKWDVSFWGEYAKTYNFSRDYLAFYSGFGGDLDWKVLNVLDIGTSLNAFIEGNPDNKVEDVTVNARPYFSLTPVNDLNVRMYVDDVYLHSTDDIRQMIVGFLFSYNFRPKSWIYLAINEIRDRSDEYDDLGKLLPNRLHLKERVSVFKVKYLYYF